MNPVEIPIENTIPDKNNGKLNGVTYKEIIANIRHDAESEQTKDQVPNGIV